MNFAARIAELTQQLSEKENAHATLQASHKSLTEQLATANEQIKTLTDDLAQANATIGELKPKADKTAEQIKTGIVEGIAAAGVPPVARIDEASDKIDAPEKPKLTGMAKATAYLQSRQPAATK